MAHYGTAESNHEVIWPEQNWNSIKWMRRRQCIFFIFLSSILLLLLFIAH